MAESTDTKAPKAPKFEDSGLTEHQYRDTYGLDEFGTVHGFTDAGEASLFLWESGRPNEALKVLIHDRAGQVAGKGKITTGEPTDG